jgi:hypothetical protein
LDLSNNKLNSSIPGITKKMMYYNGIRGGVEKRGRENEGGYEILRLY